jgi:hypothetical protein
MEENVEREFIFIFTGSFSVFGFLNLNPITKGVIVTV